MALAIKKISDDLYDLSLTPPDVEEAWSPQHPLTGQQLIRILADGGYHMRDIYDELCAQDPKWSEKLRGPQIPSSDNPEVSIPGVFPMQSRLLGMANGSRCIPSIYSRLREIRLQLPVPSFERVQATWRALGTSPPNFENEPVQVVLMDWHVGNGTATVMANPDGNTDLFFSDGGVFSGASQRYPTICAAGLHAIAAARGALPLFRPSSTIDLPPEGSVTFYLKANGKLLTASSTEENVRTRSGPMHALFSFMEEIVAAYRLKFPK